MSSLVDLSRSHSIPFWLMGGIAIHSYGLLALVAVLTFAGSLVLVREAPRLNLLALGDESAQQLGIGLGQLRRRVLHGSWNARCQG